MEPNLGVELSNVAGIKGAASALIDENVGVVTADATEEDGDSIMTDDEPN